MNSYLLAAGILTILLAIIHSVLGEMLVFRKLRIKGGLTWMPIPKTLSLRSIRILWASWHLATVCAFGFGIILFKLALDSTNSLLTQFVENSIVISMLACAIIVLIGTQGRHPGWIVLLSISTLTWLG